MEITKVVYSALLLAASALPQTGDAVSQVRHGTDVKRQELKTINFEGKARVPKKLGNAVPKVASLADFEGRKFYGAMVYSSTWDNLQITQVPYGIYEFTVGKNVTSENKYKATSLEFSAGAESRGKFYGVRPISMFGALTGVAYNEIDVVNYNGLRQLFADESTLSYSDIGSVMAYDYTDNEIYAFQYNADLTGLYWATFDREKMTFNTIANWRQKVSVVTLTSTPDGRMYGISGDGDLYEIDKEDGSAEFVGSTGVNVQNYSQSAFWDNRSGSILWTAVTDKGSELYSVDVATGKTSYITDMANNEQVVGTYINDNLAKDGAPAAITDLKLTYATPGSLSANVSFTVPSKTFDGSPMSGNVNAVVYLDGRIVKQQAEAAGAKISVPVELTEANHYVAVSLKNDVGFAPYCNLYEFAGKDIPAAVTNLNFEAKDGKAVVTWDVPSGANGGYIDSNDLFYKVYRMPENKIVAERLRTNSFSETLPSEMRAYSYKVVAYNGESREGVAAESNVITVGTAFGVPYNQKFGSKESLELFTILDLNGDNQTWFFTDWNPEVDIFAPYSNSAQEAANDWLVTPKIKLQAGKLYRFAVNFRTVSESYPETLRIAYGTDISNGNLDGFTTIADWKDLNVAIDFEDKYAEFSVPADGEYHIGLGYLSKKGVGSQVRVRSVGVEELGNTSAPGKVGDLTVTPDGDNLKATVSFTTPGKDIAGNTIDKLSSVKIYRNEETEPAKIFSAPEVNTKLNWIDENVPQVGVNTYYIVPENESGAGYRTSASNFIGVYQASSYHDPFDNSDVLNFYTYESKGKLDGNSEKFTYDPSNKLVSLQYVNSEQSVYNAWIYSPVIKFDSESVYELTFNYNCWDTNAGSKYSTYIGKSAESSAQTQKVGDLPSYVFNPEKQSQEVVITEGGKYNISWAALATQKYAYVSYGIGNVQLKYKTSAKAPYTVDNLKIANDATGALKSSLSFNAPSKDYAGRSLTNGGLTKIDIYRGENSSIPVKTFENPKPGDALTWIDEEAKQGKNTYMVVASNAEGRGKALVDSVFVGLDVPSAVTNLSITPDATNQVPTLKWDAPVKGINGGVVDKNTLVYNICSYDPNKTGNDAVKVIGQTKELAYTVERTPTDKQELSYYAVIPQTKQGIGGALISYSLLGKPFELPFKESFAGAKFENEPWTKLGSGSQAFQWGANPASSMSNYGAEPQDGDDGAAYFYNGNQYEVWGGAQMLSPKIALGGKEAELSFYVWQGRQSTYAQKPQITPMITIDESEFISLSEEPIELSEGEPRWVKYTYDLSAYKDAPCFSIIFDAKTSGYLDVVFLDNVQVVDKNGGIEGLLSSEGLSVIGVEGGIMTRSTGDNEVYVYNMAGQLVDRFVSDGSLHRIDSGIYVANVAGKTFKVVVR